VRRCMTPQNDDAIPRHTAKFRKYMHTSEEMEYNIQIS
jgi:hypothetical protein